VPTGPEKASGAKKKPPRPGAIGGYRQKPPVDGKIVLQLDRMTDDGTTGRGDRLEVDYFREDDNDPKSAPISIREIRLVFVDGATPSDIRRFGWMRWLAVAEATARWSPDDDNTGVAITAAGTKALRAEGVLRDRRPGRRGHPHEFYKEIADRYIELVRQRVHKPRLTIANERHVSVDTVAGWLKRARELNYLKRPGHRPPT